MMVCARSASDRTDDWPFWMVWDGNKNITAEVAQALTHEPSNGAVFTCRLSAIHLADAWNALAGFSS